MNEELTRKANTLFYYMTKAIARNSFADFLDELDVTSEEWEEIKKYITEQTKIDRFYV